MITDQTPKIIQQTNFWWNLKENKTLFEMKDVIYHYDPYSIKFKETTFPKMLSLERTIHLNIFLGNTLLLNAGLEIDYHLNKNLFDNLKEELLRIGKDAHGRFMNSYQEHRYQSGISQNYKPAFESSIFQDKIEYLLKEKNML